MGSQNASTVTPQPEPVRTLLFTMSAMDIPDVEEADKKTETKNYTEQLWTANPAERQPPTKKVVKYPDIGANGEPSARSRPKSDKPGY